jgi:hypothetical protein
MEIAVRREQLPAQREPDERAAALERDEFDPEQAGKRPGGRRLNARRVYLPAFAETNFATAVICWSVSVPLNAGMMPPPCST